MLDVWRENAWHVVPNYGPEHDTSDGTPRCWCSPEEEIQREDGEPVGVLIIHRECN